MDNLIFDQMVFTHTHIILLYRGILVESFIRPLANEQEIVVNALKKATRMDFHFGATEPYVQPDF